MRLPHKPAFRLVPGDFIRHDRRTWRVGHVALVVLYPRAARLTGAGSRTAYRLTLWPAKGHGGSRQLLVESADLVPLAPAPAGNDSTAASECDEVVQWFQSTRPRASIAGTPEAERTVR